VTPVSAFVVGRHAMYRRGLAASLAELPEVAVVHEVTAPVEVRPDPGGRALAVVDHDASRPPGELRGLCLATPGPVLVCLGDGHDDEVTGWIEDGVVGFLDKETVTPELLRSTVRAALAGSGVIAPDLLGRVLRGAARASALTARERRVLALLADGHSTREVALAMSYSERTVKTISHDIAMKFGARTRTQAVAHAVRAGII
jgi:DNA-binding NarL/FixJ family response regulator